MPLESLCAIEIVLTADTLAVVCGLLWWTKNIREGRFFLGDIKF